MNRQQQRAIVEKLFAAALAVYQAKRVVEPGLAGSDASHEGSVALGKALQTISLASALDIITSAEYDAFQLRITTTQPERGS